MRRLIIVDDHPLIASTLQDVLKNIEGVWSVKHTQSGEEALNYLLQHHCELMVLDISLPDMDGFEIFEKVKESFPDIKIIIYTMHRFPRYLEFFFKHGADGYLLKSGELGGITVAVEKVLNGHRFFPKEIFEQHSLDAGQLILENNQIQFTERERDILRLLLENHDNQDIARILKINNEDILRARKHMIYKTGVPNTQELLALVKRMNLIS
ncbi:MAG: response regulator transcription factor [Bacteroidota bacterium]|nr:response regulator transcription factor [Bacteroidota bacterium]MDX5446914.1 response regulator transcription factor [Bacteroidota bacterium]MDX5505158.1 response regulator transcription factor [Bacteroidota bacterium]